MQRQRGEIGDADDEDEEHAGGEVAVAEQRGLTKGSLRREGVDEEQVEGRGRDDGLDR